MMDINNLRSFGPADGTCQRCGAGILYGMYCSDCAHDILWGKKGTIKSSDKIKRCIQCGKDLRVEHQYYHLGDSCDECIYAMLRADAPVKNTAETAYARGILDGALKSLVNHGWTIDEFNAEISKGDAEVNDHFRRDVQIGTSWSAEEDYFERLNKRALEILNESLSIYKDVEDSPMSRLEQYRKTKEDAAAIKSKINAEYGIASGISKKEADYDNIFRWVEEALGFELYHWQKLYVRGDIDTKPQGRGIGKTTAYILRLLLGDNVSIHAYDPFVLTAICDGDRSNKYCMWFKSYLWETYARLRAHPMLKNKICKVYFTENQYLLDMKIEQENRQ